MHLKWDKAQDEWSSMLKWSHLCGPTSQVAGIYMNVSKLFPCKVGLTIASERSMLHKLERST